MLRQKTLQCQNPLSFSSSQFRALQIVTGNLGTSRAVCPKVVRPSSDLPHRSRYPGHHHIEPGNGRRQKDVETSASDLSAFSQIHLFI